jgi:predicted amidohydrolase
MAETIRVALAQMRPVWGDKPQNRDKMLGILAQAKEAGAQLVVFPECALSGYVFQSKEEAFPASESLDGAYIGALAGACGEANLTAIVGYLERDGDTLYNSAVVLSPEGVRGNYRKCHLPVLGVDRFVGFGDALPVLEFRFGRIGVLICYDVRFPEAARSLACNRVGEERGAIFIGRSQIIAPNGVVLQEGDGESEGLLIADIEPAQARIKKLVMEAGVFELDPIGGRRPDLYGELTRPFA